MKYPTIAEVYAGDVEAVLRWNRYLPSPRNNDEVTVINFIVKRLMTLRARDNEAYVAASKRIGWGGA